MNKNLLRTGIGIMVGGSLLVTSTVMGMAGSPSGYEAMKEALKSSRKIENATFNMTGSLSDNNKVLVKVNSTIKANEKDQSFSGNVAIDSEKTDKSYVVYSSKGAMVFKDSSSNVYNKVARNDDRRENRFQKRDSDNNPQMEALGEKILDTLVGDLKKQVTQENIGNGDTKISINLEKDEIPSLVNLALAAKGSEGCNKEFAKKDKLHELLGISKEDFKFPELTSDLKAEKIDFEMVVDQNNIIKAFDVEFDVTGKDANNQAHAQKLTLNIDVSSINSTKADTVDLKGKQIKEISQDVIGNDRD